MSITEEQCAMMAARMLDEELLAITRKIEDEDNLTPFERAVVREWHERQRALIRSAHRQTS